MTTDIKEIDDNAETIGAFLKQTRLKKGISIAKVSDDLRIRKVYIKAIEENDYSDLSPVPYGIGFVRSYASYLGLNVERVVQIYKQEYVHNDDNVQVFEPQSEITYPTRQYVICGVIAAFVVYMAAVIIFSMKEDAVKNAQDNDSAVVETTDTPLISEVDADENAEQKAGVSDSNEDSPEEDVANDEQQTQQIVVTDESYEADELKNTDKTYAPNILIKTKGSTWLQLKDKEEVYINKTVDAGFEYSFQNKEGMIISVGKPENVEIYIDGKLTTVATMNKRSNILLDKFLTESEH